MEDRCIVCDAIIPEGRQVCQNCEKVSATDEIFVDANHLCNSLIRRWLRSRKCHRKSRWLKKWNRLVRRYGGGSD